MNPALTPVDTVEKGPKVIDVMDTDSLTPMELRTLEDALIHYYRSIRTTGHVDVGPLAEGSALVIKDIRTIIEKLTGQIL